MKSKIFITMCMALLFTVVAHTAFAGSAKLAVSNMAIESGEELGVAVVLGGTGKHDVYAAFTGGLLGNELFLFNGGPSVFQHISQGLPKLMDNVDIESLSADKSIITLLPKFQVADGASLAGIYTFYVALATPGTMNFVSFDTIAVEIKK